MLQIPRAKVEDAGRYTCVAVNEAGEDSLQYDVRVLCESFSCLSCVLSPKEIFEELMFVRCCIECFKDCKDNQNVIVQLRNYLIHIENTLVRSPEVSDNKLASTEKREFIDSESQSRG